MRAFVILVVLGCWAAGLADAITCGQCAHTVVTITKEDAAKNGEKFKNMHGNDMPKCARGIKNWYLPDMPKVQCKRCGYIDTSFDFTYKQAEGKMQMFAIGCDDKPDQPYVGCAEGELAVEGITDSLEEEMDIKISNMEPTSKACNCDVPLCDDNPIPAAEAVKCRKCGHIAIDITEPSGTSGSEFKENFDFRLMKNCKPGTTDFTGMEEETCRKRCGFVNTKLDFNVDGAKGEMQFFGLGCDDYPHEEMEGCVEMKKGRDDLAKALEYQFEFKVLKMHNDSMACSCNGENCAAKLSGQKKSAITGAAGGIVPSLVLIVMTAALKVFY